MPLIIPIGGASVAPVAANFESGSELTALGGFRFDVGTLFASDSTLTPVVTNTLNENALFLSASSLNGILGVTIFSEVAFLSNSALLADLRLNDEANIFPAAGFLSDSVLEVDSSAVIRQLIALFASDSNFIPDLSIDVAPDFGFTVFVDVLDTAVVAAQAGRIRRYTSRLLVDGIEVPIRRAELEAAPDTLGMELRVTLARPDVAQISLTSEVTFQIGIWTGSAFQYIPLITGGKLSARGNAIKNSEGRPTDEITISIIDVIADRWNRAPREPIHLYDSYLLDAPTQSEINAQRIQLEDGTSILPVNIPIAGMRLHDILDRAYVSGTGFASVITNIPNFPVSEADFSLDGGYDGGVRPLLSLFSPLLFTDQNNNLFIIDPDAALPAGFSPRDYVQSNIIQLTDSMPQREPVNAILVRMKTLGTGGEVFTERLDHEHQESGTFGLPSFTETDITRRVREYRTIAEPLVIIREEVVEETSTTTDWEFNPIEETVVVEHFDILGRKTGYTRTVARRLPDIDNDGDLILFENVLRQTQSIVYATNPLNPHEDVQERVTTVESGLVLVDDGNEYLGSPYRIPLTDAHVSGYIDPAGEMHVETMDIRTTVEQLRVRGEQVDVETRVINHLSNAPTRTSVTTRPGAVTIDRRKQASSRAVLLTIEGTGAEGRRVHVFDAGELPGDIAMELGLRKLQRLNNPPREIQMPPAFIDLSIRRGVVLRPHAREDLALGDYIVTGFTITIDEYNKDRGIIAAMTVTARELTT